MSNEFYNSKEAMRALGCGRPHLMWLIREKKLTKYKAEVGGLRFSKKEIDELIKPIKVS